MGMHRSDDPATFLDSCADALRADPVGFNFPGTVAHSEVARGVRRSTYLWWEEQGAVRAVCLCYPGEPVALSGAGTAEAESFADALLDPPDVRGVRGPVEAARAFAQRWQERTGQVVEREMAQGVYVCDRVAPPVGVAGSPRQAVAEDVDTVFERLVDFADEVGVGTPHRETAGTMVAGGRLWWWTDPGRCKEPVAMAAVTPAPLGVARIGAVHTPPAHRRNGYASALTAHLTARVLAAGDRVMLYTDLDNPTSNGIYAAIGFQRVGDAIALWFEQP
jgi:predicted GNAT family acetyltransferase